MRLCKCGCGQPTVIAIRTDRSKGWVKGEPKPFVSRHSRKGKHGMTKTPEYKAYVAAKCRCVSPTDLSWENYGGRGIEFRFESFEDFYACLGPKPSPKHSVDRINNDGHYEWGNVRWATQSEQNSNRRPYKKGPNSVRICELCGCETLKVYVTGDKKTCFVCHSPTCKEGHPRLPDNILLSEKGWLCCRICHNKRKREYMRSRRAKMVSLAS